MARWRAFVVSGSRLTAHHRHRSGLLDPFSFEVDEEGLARFTRYLDRFPSDVTCLVADVVEEFRERTVPHVFVRDRRALLRARAARTFPDARYVHSLKLGREPEGRRDDRVLFSTITRPEALVPWLAPMERHAVPLAGICSPAMLTGSMLKAIGAEGEHVLVASLQSGGELRQTCFRRGRLQLSRLAAMPDPAAGRYASHVLAEVERTRRYLDTLHAPAHDGQLEVYVLSHGEPLEELRCELRHDAGGGLRAVCTAVDLAEVARGLGMRRWDGGPAADRLFVHVLARRASPNHYATSGETRHFSMLRVRSFLKAASAGLVAGGCLFGGVTFLEGVIAGGHTRALALQSALYEHRYHGARAELPPAPAEPADLERAVSAVRALRLRRADPVELFTRVSHALAGFPRVRIDGFSWRAGGDAQRLPEGRAGDEDSGRAAPAPAGEEPRRGPGGPFQTALVSARIEPFDGDYRAAIDTVRGFAGALAALPGVEHVRVTRLPLDLSPERTLSGEAGTPAGAAEFEIRVALRNPVSGPASRRAEPVTGGGRATGRGGTAREEGPRGSAAAARDPRAGVEG